MRVSGFARRMILHRRRDGAPPTESRGGLPIALEGTIFYFVTDGIESAYAQAVEAAGVAHLRYRVLR
jgi:hypothetical protein